MPSLGVLNALLNCGMMVTYAVAALAIERAYVYAAKLHLAAHGTTATTNSAEVHVSHWVLRLLSRDWRRHRLAGAADGRHDRGDGVEENVWPQEVAASCSWQSHVAVTDSAAGGVHATALAGTDTVKPSDRHVHTLVVRPLWSLALLLLLIALLPAELYFETGLGEEPKGRTREVERHNGICASPWTGHSSVGVSAAALLAQRLNWLDPVWTAVPEGASKKMIIAERFAWPAGSRRLGESQGEAPGGSAVVAADCSITIGTCVGGSCGNLVIHRTSGPFHTIATGASLAGVTNSTFPAPTDTTGRFSMGDLTYDGATGVAFLFWEVPPPPEAAAAAAPGLGRRTVRVHVRAVEVVLNASEVDRVFDPDPTPWTLPAVAGRARTYAVALSTDGLRAADVVMAASIFRTGQMEQPGVRRTDVHSQIERLPPMTSSDVLKALLALKAEDGNSNCAGTVEEYLPRGTFRLVTALPFTVAVVVVLGVWAALATATRGLADLHIPHDADSWRSFALAAHGWSGPAGSIGEGWEGSPPQANEVQWRNAPARGSKLTPAVAPPPCPSMPALEDCVSVVEEGPLSETPSAVGYQWRRSLRASTSLAAASEVLRRTNRWRVQVAPPGRAVTAGVVFLSPLATVTTPPADVP
ncbi:hypothetical protein MMPV_006523 [Pyropia vietnamensis]